MVERPNEFITRSSVPRRALHRLSFTIGEQSLQSWQSLDWKDLYIRGSEASVFKNTLTQRQYTVDSDGELLDSVSEHDEPPPEPPLSPRLQAQLDAVPTPSHTPNASPTDSAPEIKSESSVKTEIKQEAEDEILKQELETAIGIERMMDAQAASTQAASQVVTDSPPQEHEESPQADGQGFL